MQRPWNEIRFTVFYEGGDMKLKKMKQAAAVLLSAAMAFSMPAAVQVTAVSASVKNPKYVKLNTAFKTLKEGQSNYKLYLTNNKAGWKIQKVTVSDKSVAGAYGKKAASIRLKGKKEGNATVTLKLKTNKRKKNNVKKLKCRVRVVPVTAVQEKPEVPVQPPVTPGEASMEVSSQAKLEEALANASLKTLSIKTADAVKLVIPAGSYSGVALTVDAPNAEIENHGVFQSIKILAIRENTWLEEAIGNNLQVAAASARIVVGKDARAEKIDFMEKGADIKLEVHGAVSSVAVSATMKIEISGEAVSVPVILTANAAGTEVIATVPVQVTTDVDASFVFGKGAEGSKIKATLRSIKLTLTNNTLQPIPVEKADGTTQNVPNTGRPYSVTPATGSGSGTYNPGTYYPGSGSGSDSTVKRTLPTVSVRASVRPDTATRGALIIDKKDIVVSGCVSPVIKNLQWSGHRGAYMYAFETDSAGRYVLNTGMLGLDNLEETMEWGRGVWVLVTVEDQGSEYAGWVIMPFSEMITAANKEKTFKGNLAKKSSMTLSFRSEVISGSAIAAAPDKGWIRTVIPYESVQFQGGSSPRITGGTAYDVESNMTFKLVNETSESRWMAEKNGRETFDKLMEQVQAGISRNECFQFVTIQVTDNGKKYAGTVSAAYRDYFAADKAEKGKCSFTIPLYEYE